MTRLWITLAMLAIVSGTGCGTMNGPGSASLASVTIRNRTQAEIATATSQVFAAEGFRGGSNGAGELMFDRPASQGTTLMREGVVATQAGAQTLSRVRVQIVPLPGDEHRLQCRAFAVTDANDPFFMEETPLANVRSLAYQPLLDKVKQQLEQPTPK